MKKRLLFAALALVCATGAFAFEEGEYAYTATGRVKVTGSNLLTNGNFSDGTAGWTNVEYGDINAEVWGLEPGVGVNGENAIMSLGATEGEAVCLSMPLVQTEADGSYTLNEEGQVVPLAGGYVVSFQIRATGETTTGTTSVGATVGNNYADIFLGYEAGLARGENAYGIAAAENFTEEWKTVNYYFEVSDTIGAPAFFTIHLEKMATGVQLTNFSLNTAEQVFDIRIAARKFDFAKKLLDDPNFNTADAEGPS